MKILFIVPPSKTYEDFVHPIDNARLMQKNGRFYGNIVADMPIGVLSLSAFIKQTVEVQTDLLDFNIHLHTVDKFNYNSYYDFFETVITEEINYQPDIVCISTLFGSAYESTIQLANLCRKRFASSFILGGGAIPTIMYKDIYERTNSFDALCYGEGEKPLLEFISSQHKQEYLETNTTWITQKKISRNDSYEFNFITNLDTIPFYDYHLCDKYNYGISPAIVAYSSVQEKSKNYHVMTSRGCQFRCTFCASHAVHGREMRYFSLERVEEDFKRLRNEFNAHTLIFQDDQFLKNRSRALDIIALIKRLQINVVFQNGLSLHLLTRDILEALKDAGVRQLVLPVESGSQRVLTKLMKKPLTLEAVKRVARDCRELDIYTDVNIIIGMPGETEEDLQDARMFLRTIPTNWFRIHVATPLVGSEMYDICIKNGYLKYSFASGHYKKAIIETEYLSAERVEQMQTLMNFELNFVYNHDFTLGFYNNALHGFHNAISARSDHALAYYFAAKCYQKLNDEIKADEYMTIARDLVNKDTFWQNYFALFNLTC